ncbi:MULTISPECIES: HNH endonuclease [Micrococcus]|nr:MULTISPECIES: HNH endonuclease signature motif containing protein [Micrococcus]MCV7674868.1 HNH endonuclease [Micrococcus luteus]TFE81804.1 HNH endonuclease [Micrococcus yunnanensis]
MRNRPKIPNDVKRAVRQRCGFGCILCGMPLFDYEHIVEYSQVRTHEADNIVLLCPNHHALKTRKQMSTAELRGASEAPFNRGKGVTTPRDFSSFQPPAKLIIGTNVAVIGAAGGSALQVDGQDLLRFDFVEGRLVLGVDIEDSRGQLLLKVESGELIHSTTEWDYEYVANRLRIRAAPGEIVLDIVFDYESNAVEVVSGFVSRNGVDILFNKNGLVVLNNMALMSNCTNVASSVAYSLGDPLPAEGVGIAIEIPRGPYDRDAAIEEGRKRLSEVPTLTAPTEVPDRFSMPPLPPGGAWLPLTPGVQESIQHSAVKCNIPWYLSDRS